MKVLSDTFQWIVTVLAAMLLFSLMAAITGSFFGFLVGVAYKGFSFGFQFGTRLIGG